MKMKIARSNDRVDITENYTGNFQNPDLGPGYINHLSTFYKPKKGGIIFTKNNDTFFTNLQPFRPGPGEYKKRCTFSGRKKIKYDFSKLTKRKSNVS